MGILALISARFSHFGGTCKLAQEGGLWQISARLVGPPSGARFFTSTCCRSSVVEHSIGNGEVDSSILSGSTIRFTKTADYRYGLRSACLVAPWGSERLSGEVNALGEISRPL